MIGNTVSHYKIIEKLGEGGMGVVYRARDTKLDREVAIKLLPPHLSSDPEAVKRFVHEAKTASALNHSAIGVIHEIDETDDGQTFIVMALYEGGTLRERLDSGPMVLGEAAAIASQLASGLAAAHEKGIVHRDIKPQNILLTRSGEAKIIDFGLAMLTGRTRLTRDGSTLGTAAYMSPEQARGEEVDHRSDIFSLGTILYEMLAGEQPFKGDHEAALLYGVVHEEHRQLSESGLDFPDPLHEIVNKALEKDPDDRYQSALEFNEDIAEFRGQTLTRSGVRSRAGKAGSRRNVLLAGIAGATVVVALVAVLWPRFMGTEQSESVTLAVVDFNDVSSSPDSLRSAGIAGLLHVGLVENSPCRVLSPSYLKDIRRRLFDVTQGPIDESQAIEIARKSGATMLLYGQMGELDGQPYIAWQLVDTETGESVAARRVEGTRMAALADEILEGVLSVLAPRCGAAVTLPVQSVTELTTSDPEAYEYYVAAGLARERVEANKQVDLLKNAVAHDSTFALAYFELAKVYLTYNHPATAREYTESAWRWRSRLSIRDRMRLDAWRDQMNYRVVDAIEVLRELHARWPDDKEILKELENTLYFWRYTRENFNVIRQGMALFPDDAHFVMNYQTTLAHLDRPDEALEAARDLVKRFPENPNHWDELARRFIEAGLPDSAEVAIQRTLEIAPDLKHPLFLLAKLAYYRGDLNVAIDNLEELGSQVNLIDLYCEAGRYERALELFDEGRRPSSDPATRLARQMSRSRLLLWIGRAEEVLRWTDTVMEVLVEGGETTDNPLLAGMVRKNIPNFRAHALAAMDSLEVVRSIASNLMDLVPEFGNILRIYALRINARIALKEGDPTAALTALDQLRQEGFGGEERALFYNREMRAEAYMLAGRLEDAAAVHKELLRVRGGHAVSHYNLGLIYEEMGCPHDAKQEFTRFLEMWDKADEGLPQLEDARVRLAKLKGINH